MLFPKLYAAKLALLSISLVQVLASSLPAPKGPHKTTLATLKLLDHSRSDPYKLSKTPRALMLSVFTPLPPCKCIKESAVEYMPALTADYYDQQYAGFGIPAGTFGSFKLVVCSKISKGYRAPENQFPVVIFSPGLGNSRLIYNSIAQAVASEGYVVVSIDHTYDAPIVTFPDNSTAVGLDIESDAEIEFTLDVRSKDVSFVIDQLGKSVHPGLNNKHVGFFGHSLGGATALSAMVNDSRIVGGVNLDGSFFGPAIKKGTKRPFLIVGHEGKNQSTDASWAEAWKNLKGWKLELGVEKTAHGSFTDLPVLIDVLGLTEKLPEEVVELLGSLGGPRGLEIIRVYVGAFFDRVLKGKSGRLLKGASGEYPEVVFVDQ